MQLIRLIKALPILQIFFNRFLASRYFPPFYKAFNSKLTRQEFNYVFLVPILPESRAIVSNPWS